LKKRELTYERVSSGAARFIVGLGKKVLISNQMGLVADSVFGASVSSLNSFSAWLGAVCYSLQIFFDFSGYSDMAIGLGCIFGFDFKENFKYPFISHSMQEFWRRWHISLSTWFKEYVYIPLGGNRKGKVRTNVNRTIVFLLTGLWHGANLTFIVWGLLHGAFLLLEGTGILPTGKKWFRPFGHIYALFVTLTTFVIFRADTLTQGFGIIAAMFGRYSGDAAVNAQIFSGLSALFVTALIFAVLLSTPIVPKLKSALAKYAAAEYVGYFGTLVIFALSILSLISGEYNPFIYFRF
jgi:alginate O-acetyltransferase complex protein AlgI